MFDIYFCYPTVLCGTAIGKGGTSVPKEKVVCIAVRECVYLVTCVMCKKIFPNILTNVWVYPVASSAPPFKIQIIPLQLLLNIAVCQM